MAEMSQDAEIHAIPRSFREDGIPADKTPIRNISDSSCKGSFDSVIGSLCEPITALKMTFGEKAALLVAQSFDRIEPRGFNGGQHSADNANEAEDGRRPDQCCGVDIQMNVAFAGIFDECAPQCK